MALYKSYYCYYYCYCYYLRLFLKISSTAVEQPEATRGVGGGVRLPALGWGLMRPLLRLLRICFFFNFQVKMQGFMHFYCEKL